MNQTRCPLTLLTITLVCFLLPTVFSLPVSNPTSSRLDVEKPHSRVKRQYFKPSIDGSWIANERSLLLKHSKLPAAASSTTTTTVANAVALKSTKEEIGSSTAKSDVTVHSLAHSLINLFDRIKHTLCKIVNSECVNHANVNNSTPSQPGRN